MMQLHLKWHPRETCYSEQMLGRGDILQNILMVTHYFEHDTSNRKYLANKSSSIIKWCITGKMDTKDENIKALTFVKALLRNQVKTRIKSMLKTSVMVELWNDDNRYNNIEYQPMHIFYKMKAGDHIWISYVDKYVTKFAHKCHERSYQHHAIVLSAANVDDENYKINSSDDFLSYN